MSAPSSPVGDWVAVEYALQRDRQFIGGRQQKDLFPMLRLDTPSAIQSKVVHPRYRPDINGLRALAVLAVLLFHAFPAALPGGFVGVDVFFVISGYLISTIILQNLGNGSFSFVDFYARRVRRIFPALLLVLFSCLVLGWFVLVAQEYAQLGRHIAAGAGFVSNLILWSESGYFDTASSAKPLLHLWSLGVEEQFYIVWPLLVWWIWRKQYGILAMLLALLLLSFCINVYTVGGDPVAAYYSPVGRFWELLVGALLAHRTLSAHSDKPASHANLRAAVGLLLITVAVVTLDKKAAFPGWWAVLPVAGAALLISAGDEAWLNRHVLASRGMVWIGLISYPLYLWHWPLLSLAEIIAGQPPAPQYRVACLLLALSLAWLSYLLVERPFRAAKYRLRQVLWLVALMTLLGCLGLNIQSRDGLPFRHEQLSPVKDAGARSAGFTSLGVSIRKDDKNYSCADLVPRRTRSMDVFCHLSDPRPYLAVIGDSHSNHLFAGLKRSTNDQFNRVLVVGAGGCHPALRAEQSENCDDQSRANLELIGRYDTIRYVALSANASAIQTGTELKNRMLLRGYADTISQLQRMGKTVVFVLDTPDFLESPASCAPNPLPVRNRYRAVNNLCDKLSVDRTQPRDVYTRFVRDLKRQSGAPIAFFDAYSLFCDESYCRVLDDGTLLFKDSNHLTDYGSKLVADRLQKQLLN